MKTARKPEPKVLLYFSDRMIQEMVYQSLNHELDSELLIIRPDGTEAGLWISLREVYGTLLPCQSVALVGMDLDAEAERLLLEFPELLVVNLEADGCTLDVISLELTHRKYRASLPELCHLLLK